MKKDTQQQENKEENREEGKNLTELPRDVVKVITSFLGEQLESMPRVNKFFHKLMHDQYAVELEKIQPHEDLADKLNVLGDKEVTAFIRQKLLSPEAKISSITVYKQGERTNYKNETELPEGLKARLQKTSDYPKVTLAPLLNSSKLKVKCINVYANVESLNIVIDRDTFMRLANDFLAARQATPQKTGP